MLYWLKQSLIPFLEDNPYSYTDFKKNLVKIDQWGQEIQATKYSNCTILPLVAEIQNALFLVDLCKISVYPTFSITTNRMQWLFLQNFATRGQQTILVITVYAIKMSKFFASGN